MELDTLIKERRSIRLFEESSITDEELITIIKASQLAPSWKNSQSSRFYVANRMESIEAVKECLALFNQKSSNNTSYIVATYKKGVSGLLSPGEPSPEADDWAIYDLGLNNAYLVLKAKDMGYDSLIMGIRDAAKLREVLNIPDDEVILPVIAIGKRKGEALFRERFETEEVVTFK